MNLKSVMAVMGDELESGRTGHLTFLIFIFVSHNHVAGSEYM